MDAIANALSWLLLCAGSFFCLVGGVGLLRLPDFYTRLHAGGVTDAMGAGLIILGLIFQAGFSQETIKLLMILFFLLLSSPTATHAVAKAALKGGVKPLAKTDEVLH